jgi:hypothetical protein
MTACFEEQKFSNLEEVLAGKRDIVVSRMALAAGRSGNTRGSRHAAHEARVNSKLRRLEVKVALSS